VTHYFMMLCNYYVAQVDPTPYADVRHHLSEAMLYLQKFESIISKQKAKPDKMKQCNFKHLEPFIERRKRTINEIFVDLIRNEIFMLLNHKQKDVTNRWEPLYKNPVFILWCNRSNRDQTSQNLDNATKCNGNMDKYPNSIFDLLEEGTGVCAELLHSINLVDEPFLYLRNTLKLQDLQVSFSL
jgi:hypothetical protein